MNPKYLLLLAAMCASAYAAEQPEVKGNGAPQTAPESETLPGANEEPVPGEPQVTITKQSEQTIEEFRVGGRLYMIKITPKHGHPYYLIDDRGDGRFARQEGLDSGVRVPQWVIKKF